MKALILAGGKGTRMRPLTERVSKQLLPVCNVPFLEHQIRLLARHGVDEAVLLTGYLASDFDSFVTSVARHGVHLTISTEDEPLGTAGAVRKELDGLDETFLVFNGDVLTDVDITALLEQHRARDASVTMYLSPVPDSGGFGVVEQNDDGRVLGFTQNPPGTGMPPGWINAGIYAMEPAVIGRVPAGGFADFERPPGEPLFPALVAEGAPFFGFRSEAYWLDIGTRERYLQAHRDVLDGSVDTAVTGTMLREDKTLGDGTTLLAPLLLSHAPVGAGATLGPHTVLGQGCKVGRGATIERAVIHDGAVVEENAVVRDAVVGRGAVVAAGTTLDGDMIA